ncbi:serine hydrolase domain-containing protein [Chitinophaga flava]|uniref:Serine hydrolase n=1 Tax=Chitinophaga flava TaxID=2259036 RepID=A0A365Y037_9BACT|nr:serine hydrolase domain-containing protein [Chitinophaga flava]RBL91969.1 serine hydrolase [Chitinophaga flava]
MKSQIDQVIEKAIEKKTIVGTEVIVAKEGRLVYHRAEGLADREKNLPMKENSIFRLASITKPIVSTVVMKFVEDGKITLQDVVSTYLPDFKPKTKTGSTPEITIHQLLTHTAGLSYSSLEPIGGIYDQLKISDGIDQPGLSIEENLSRLVKAPLGFEPGTNWAYSLAIDILGNILEIVSGKSLPELVSAFITTPLQMHDTSFRVMDIERLVTPYADGTPEPVKMFDGIEVPFQGGVTRFAPSRVFNEKSYPSGGSGLTGTASDLLKFFEAIRKGGAPLLHEDTVKTMMTDKTGTRDDIQGPGWGFGYGWAILQDRTASQTPQANGTIQWGGAYGNHWFIDPVNELTVISLTNTSFEGMAGAFPANITRAAYE